MKQKIGLDVPLPEQKQYQKDLKCPFTGQVTVKKETLVGTVIKTNVHNTATIEWERVIPVPKFERYEKRRSKIHVHNSPCVNAQVGDLVLVAKTRPLSKTKNHAIVQVIKRAGT